MFKGLDVTEDEIYEMSTALTILILQNVNAIINWKGTKSQGRGAFVQRNARRYNMK